MKDFILGCFGLKDVPWWQEKDFFFYFENIGGGLIIAFFCILLFIVPWVGLIWALIDPDPNNPIPAALMIPAVFTFGFVYLMPIIIIGEVYNKIKANYRKEK